MNDILRQELDDLKAKGLGRSLRRVASAQGREIIVDGKRVLNFCSNDYLGLAADPRLTVAAQEIMARRGFGSGASRLVCGNFDEHALLEKELASFKKTEATLVFSSGYMANVGIISALCGREDIVLSDRLNHASIIDGAILSRAEFVRYAHADMVLLEEALKKASGYRRKLIVTDTVFSMDGDVAPLREIVDLAERYGAWVMVDEAHAVGVLGETGAGLVEELGLGDKIHVQMGTLSKSAGGFGAYVAGSKELIEYLVNSARSFIFTTAMPPAVAAADRVALKIIISESDRRKRLMATAASLRGQLQSLGFDTMKSTTPIIPVLLGDAERAVRFSKALWDEGILAQAIRPPTVPVNMARLRVTVTALHTEEDVTRCVEAFGRVRDKFGNY